MSALSTRPVGAPTTPATPAVPAAVGLLVPVGAPVLWPGEPASAAAALAGDASASTPGSPVALADQRPFGRARLRRAAGRLGVEVEAEYVVLPSWGSATFVAADDRDALSWLLSSFLTAPPRLVRGQLLLEVARRVVALVTRTGPGRGAVRLLVGALVPGRLVVGVRR